MIRFSLFQVLFVAIYVSLLGHAQCQLTASTESELRAMLGNGTNPIYIAGSIPITSSLGTVSNKQIIGLGNSVLNCGDISRLLNAGENLSIQNLMIANCGDSSGSIVVNSATSLSMENVTMANCSSDYIGGCIYGQDGYVNVKNLIVDGCTSMDGWGAAISIQDPILARIENSTFSCPTSLSSTTSIIRTNTFAANCKWEFAGDIKFYGNRGTLIQAALQTANYNITFTSDPSNPANFIFNDNLARYGIEVQDFSVASTFNMTFNSIIATQPPSSTFIPLRSGGDIFTLTGNLIEIEKQSYIGLAATLSKVEVKNISISNSNNSAGIIFTGPTTLTCDTELRLRKTSLQVSTNPVTINAETIDISDLTDSPFEFSGNSGGLTINSPGPLRIYGANTAAFLFSPSCELTLNVKELDIQRCSDSFTSAIELSSGQFHVNAEKVTISRNSGKGALFASAAAIISLNVSNEIIFEDNYGDTSQANLISLTGSSMTLNASSITFRNTTSRIGSGAVISGLSSSTVTLLATDSIIFEDNSAYINAGTISLVSSSLTVKAPSIAFRNNSVEIGFAGVITGVSSSTVSMDATNSIIFENNSANSKSGAISFVSSSLNLNSSSIEFRNNRARQGTYGVIEGTSASTFSFAATDSIIFEHNSARDDIGSVSLTASSLILKATSIVFRNNTAQQGIVGALAGTSSTISFDATDSIMFEGNRARTNVGAVLLVLSSLSMNASSITFRKNAAQEEASGALFATGDVTIMLHASDSVVFEDNSAGISVGAVALVSTSLSVNASSITFRNNTAQQGSAGAISAGSTSTISMHATDSIVFERNSANGNGGAVAMYNPTTSITLNASSVSFLSNTAGGAGGSLYLIDASLSINTAGNTIFSSCRSSVDGGAIYANSSNLHFITNSTIFELNRANVSGGALLLVEGASAQFNESSYAPVFRSNRADIGGAVKIFGDVAQSYISNSSFWNNTAREGCFASFAETSTCPVFGGQIMSNRGLSRYRYSNCLEVDNCFSGCVSPPLTCAKCGEYQRWIVTTECVESAFGPSNTSQVLDVKTPVVLIGNFSFTQVQIGGVILLPSGDAVITSDDCVEVGEVEIVLTDDDAKQLEGGKKLALIKSACQTKPKLSTRVQNSCKQASASSESTEDNGKFTLNAVFTIDNKKCNRWWIILVSVLGGAVLIMVVIFLLYRFTSCKTVIRPFSSANS